MKRYARSYGSENYPENINQTWQFPTGPAPDNFGVPVPEVNKTFGLEEFNFNPYFLKEKIAYIPCFGTTRYYPRPYLKELRLIYKTGGRCHMHYATLFEVTSILDEEIPAYRNQIEALIHEIYFEQQTQDFFGKDFQYFAKIIERMKNSNAIASNNDNTPFLVNVTYKKLVILKTPIPCELNPKNVNQWKINASIPRNCSF